MSQRTITIIIAALLFAIGGVLLISQHFMLEAKHPNFKEKIAKISDYAIQQKWEEAEQMYQAAREQLDRAAAIMVIKYDSEVYLMLETVLERMEAAIIVHDQAGAVREAKTAMILYDSITSVTLHP
ncbi:hypothetical protein [Paenibacillus faecalis]|uniref:hypothetical protein n=1 Tax=Paenibacillus faecalis TaxID=2079532 RepID=UPI000D1081F2|nr:hypothetical protein [Paenibacillus faecalis]